MQYLLSILVFAVVLLILVLVHEAGHFFAAKFFKVKVEEFGFGLPPRLWGKKIGETLYSLNWIPAGGFVRLYGEDSADPDKLKEAERSFAHKPPYVRAIIASAGVVMNFLLTVVVFTILYTMGGPIDTGRVYIGRVASGSPAETVGLKEGDIIAQVNNIDLKGPEDLHKKIYSSLGQDLELTILRDGTGFEVKVAPRQDPPPDQGALGIATGMDIQKVSYPIWQAPIVGLNQSINLTGQYLNALGGVASDLVTKQKAPEDLGGATRIVYYTHLAVKTGVESVLVLLGLLSLNLAILNILPLPALDGGRVFFILIEALTGRKVSPNFERWLHTTGFALLLILIVLITFNDVVWLLSNTYVGNQIRHFFY